MKKIDFEIEENEGKLELVLKKIAKAIVVIATLLNNLLLHSILYIATFFESDVQYGGGAVDNEILERINYDKEQEEFQNEVEKE